MRLLLDTHTLLWWALDDRKLPAIAHDAIAAPEAEVFVSAASAWELATKVRLGRLPEAATMISVLPDYLTEQGFRSLPVTLEHGQRAGALPGPHQDPFDRMLVAQAHAENLVLVSNERVFDRYGVVRLW